MRSKKEILEEKPSKARPPMSIRYTKIIRHPTLFLRLFGLSPTQFKTIITQIAPLFETQIMGRYKRPGRHYKLSIEEMVMMVLLYYRSYCIQVFIGYLFGIDDSRVCRIIQKIEPLLAKVMAIPKHRCLSQKDVEDTVLDATEQPIERPSKNQKSYYSGKKKRHTIKTEIRTNRQGKIIHVSKGYPGRMHDYNIHKQEPPLHPHSRVFADSGYQGLDKKHRDTEIPFKASLNKPLDEDDQDYNSALSRIRVVIENIIGDIKTFRIVSDRYRNKRKRYSIQFQIIAGIVNLKNGFTPA